jgi:hypothetical protein
VTQAQPLEREERCYVIAALPVAELMHEDQAQTAREETDLVERHHRVDAVFAELVPVHKRQAVEII